LQEWQKPPDAKGHQLGKDDNRGRNMMQQWLTKCSIL
jgi:hypothetical protein